MQTWCDDLATCSLEELFQRQAQNRDWNRQLRLSSNELVNRRLARAISQADYLASRDLAQEEVAECRRRAAVLESQIAGRVVR